MPVEESTFNWLRDLTLADLIQLATWIPLLIRAKLCGQQLDYIEIHNTTLNQIQEEAANTRERQNRAWLVRPDRSRSRSRSRDRSSDLALEDFLEDFGL